MKTRRIASLLCVLFVFVTSVYAATIYTEFNIEDTDKSYTWSSEKKIGSAKNWYQITNKVYNDTAKLYTFNWYPKGFPGDPMFKSAAASKKERVHMARGPSPVATEGTIAWPTVSKTFAANY